MSDPPDRMWEKYCDPNKGNYNVQQFSVGDTCSEIASQEKMGKTFSQVFSENEKLKYEIDSLRKENQSLKAENKFLKEQFKKLQSQADDGSGCQ